MLGLRHTPLPPPPSLLVNSSCSIVMSSTLLSDNPRDLKLIFSPFKPGRAESVRKLKDKNLDRARSHSVVLPKMRSKKIL